MTGRPQPPRRGDFLYFRSITTRWMDNDLYGHVNNVVYYSYFDTVIAHYLMEEGGLDPWRGEVIGYAVESGCRYFRPLAFPDRVEAGLRVARLGNSSVTYEIGIFRNDEEEACAAGRFVHVFVDRRSERPVPLPPALRLALRRITAGEGPPGPGD